MYTIHSKAYSIDQNEIKELELMAPTFLNFIDEIRYWKESNSQSSRRYNLTKTHCEFT